MNCSKHNGPIGDIPLYCRKCDAWYCVDCYNAHLLEYLPNVEFEFK